MEDCMQTPADLYLDLMKKCLTYSLWGEVVLPLDIGETRSPLKRAVLSWLSRRLARKHIRLARDFRFDPDARAGGREWPPSPMVHTMVGFKRLDNIQACVRSAIDREVPGDLIETGVWRGGACIFMRAVLKACNCTNRTVWAADSFEGLPPPDPRYPQDAGDTHFTHKSLAVSVEEVRANFERYGLLDEQVKFLKGWFRDTLPGAPIKSIAVMRLDGDMYESTTDALVNLYPRLSRGGFVIIDDYSLPGCRSAVTDFRAAQGIADEVRDIDGLSVYWQRG
jgi:O-methyltransferase